MAAYETVSVCEDCKLVFPNRAVKVEGNLKEKRKSFVRSYAKARCPECGKEINTLIDTGYWIRVS